MTKIKLDRKGNAIQGCGYSCQATEKASKTTIEIIYLKKAQSWNFLKLLSNV